jgi:hypothetical protein
VVSRSELVRPGSPYVVAQCVDHRVAAVLSLTGHETYRLHEMERDPALARALEAWDAADDELRRLEAAAEAALRGGTRGPRLPHPSRLARS